MFEKRLTPMNIFFLILLWIVCWPAGVVFLGWMALGKKGIFYGLGCMMLPLLLVLLWIGCVWLQDRNPDTGKNIPSVEWLPAEANDVSWYKSYSYTAVEFKCTEEIFRSHYPYDFREINQPESIRRYNHDYITVKNGIHASERWSNGGGYNAIYDRDSGTGYFQSNPR